MLTVKFDASKQYLYLRYGRMSGDNQNPRSPDQQFDSVAQTLARLGHPWRHLRDYRDDAITGKYMFRRKGFAQMIQDIRSGEVCPDLILVDNIERLGRNDEIPGLRKELLRKHGILVLTSDTNFGDPTSPQGEFHAVYESFRAKDANRIKSLEVARGKRDAINSEGLWPGGPAPFGYRLNPVAAAGKAAGRVAGYRLVPDPKAAPVVRRMFAVAHATGHGAGRVAKALNADPDVPADFKDFTASFVAYVLANPIYVGELVWGRYSFDIIDDTRVRQANSEKDVLRVAGFCESLIDAAVFADVRRLRLARAEGIRRAREAARDEKLIRPLAPGLVLKYLLTGLARCGVCGRSMTPASSAAYTLKSTGESRRYVAYVCPGYAGSGACANGTRIPEPWLREQVADLIRRRLFGVGGD
jgi:site-specific DNA recombinase